MKKTVIFSPVHRDAPVLKLFLEGIKNLNSEQCTEIWLLDNNDDRASKELLVEFSRTNSNIKIFTNYGLDNLPKTKYADHYWSDELIDKIIAIKNFAIHEFLVSDFDEIFLVDSDIILNPKTLLYLQSLKIPIVSEVFWTKFTTTGNYHPNVWDYHLYKFKSADNLLRLKRPGVYEVGGLGACTLIQREPLEKGLNFSRVANLDIWGEDRHFCTRAVCLGYSLFVDTHFPAFHIYQNQLLQEAITWFQNGCQPEYFNTWLNETWQEQITEEQARNSSPKKRNKLLPRLLRKLASVLDK